jgi:spore germination protein GerM
MQAKKLICLGLVIAGVLLLAGCEGNVAKTEKEDVSPKPPVTEQNSEKINTNKLAAPNGQAPKTMAIVTYAADKEGLKLIPETHVVPFDEHPALTAVQHLLAGTRNAELIALAPAGTEEQSISIKDDIAYVSFNDKLTKATGATSEFLLVGAIVNPLTEFPEIRKVQILINDKKVATLSGHLDVSEPFERIERIIKK